MEDINQLLLGTTQKYVSATATISRVENLPIDPGVSGVNVRRYKLTLDDARQARLVTRPAPLAERRSLTRLGTQGHTCVPFSYTLDLTTNAVALVCMQDVGDKVVAYTPIASRQAAAGLAKIHQLNLGKEGELGWLPRTDRAYFVDFILNVCWRPEWERSLANTVFVREFGQYIEAVEASAANLPDIMQNLYELSDTLTLVHTDIYYSHVLEYQARPYFIDWGQTRYGSLYLDIPSHFYSLEMAQIYRQELAALSIELNPADFERNYHLAGRFVALRYVWWWLNDWKTRPNNWNKSVLLSMLKRAIG